MSDVPAIVTENEPLDLVRVREGVVTVGNPAFESVWDDGLAGGYVPKLLAEIADLPYEEAGPSFRDDNRSCVLLDRRVPLEGQEYLVNVKGCGARYDAFQPRRLSIGVLREICHDSGLRARLAGREGDLASFLTGERWWGDAPYGGQATDNALISLLASLRAEGNQIAGFYICPVVAAVQLPPRAAEVASRFYWMRRYDGPYWQEVRLVPSNVRLYFHSPLTLGVDPARVLALFGLQTLDACASFLENLLRSAVAATTLLARTLRYDEALGRYSGLDFFEVYLDKDSLVAANGILHFADLEGVEAFHDPRADAVRERLYGQYYQNVYEASYAVDTVARECWRMLGLTSSDHDRRAWVTERLERALRNDPYVRPERRGNGVVLQVAPAVDAERTAVELVWTSPDGEAA